MTGGHCSEVIKIEIDTQNDGKWSLFGGVTVLQKCNGLKCQWQLGLKRVVLKRLDGNVKMSSFQKGLSTEEDHPSERAMRNQTSSDLSKENSVLRSQNFKQKTTTLSGG